MDTGDDDLPSRYYTVYYSSSPHWRNLCDVVTDMSPCTVIVALRVAKKEARRKNELERSVKPFLLSLSPL